jgi:C1A family cysteine protease
MLKSLAAVAAFATVTFAKEGAAPMVHVAKERSAEPEWSSFVTFTHKHGRNYNTAEEVHARFNNFKATLVKNERLSKENPMATFGINKFADLSEEEFRGKYLLPVNSTSTYRSTHKLPKWNHNQKPNPLAKKAKVGANGVDWFAAGACTPVKDQQQCGSCWAFSATEAIESWAFTSGKGLPQPLAPEQIVDCDTNDSGCNGGDPRSAISYVASAPGLDFESAYPYTAGGGNAGSCQFPQGSVGVTPTGPVDVADGQENQLQSFLQNSGPPSVCVDASSWSSYTGGVLSSCGCNIDHAVQATGISADGSYYIVRNSWNTDWGINGLIWLATGANTCCVANEVSYVQ